MVSILPRIELGPYFALQMVMRVSETAAESGIEHEAKLSLFERLSRFVEDFVDMVGRARSSSTGTLDSTRSSSNSCQEYFQPRSDQTDGKSHRPMILRST